MKPSPIDQGAVRMIIDLRSRSIGVIVDATDPDNFAAVLMALFLFGRRVKFVIVTGRPAHSNPSAPMDEYEQHYSEWVLRGNTRRIKGFLRRHSYGHVLVCEGSTRFPPNTLVSHGKHIPEAEVLDIFDDNGHYEGRGEDRTFDEAIEYIKTLDGGLDLIVGGPLTEVRELLKIGEIRNKLGVMVCQLGLFSEGVTTIAGGGLTFNAAADREAVVRVLDVNTGFPGELVMVPTGVTKRHDVGFDTIEELIYLGVTEELVLLTELFHRFLPPGSRIFPHDVHAAAVMYQYYYGDIMTGPREWREMYQRSEVRVTDVGRQGQISAEFGVEVISHPKRYVVTDVNAEAFVRLYGMGCSMSAAR